MQKREGRSFAPLPSRASLPEPGRTGRKRWMRPDVPRPAAPARVLLPTLDTTLPDLETAEVATALDDFLALPQPVRRDLLAASWECGL